MPNESPNILFLLSDEHSFRFMGHVPAGEGGEPALTPNLDRLAEGATVFTDAYCQMPLCTPSRISLLTGMEARRCGAWANCSVLRPGLPTLPAALAEAGYETCLVGKMHLGGDQQFVGFKHRPYGDLTGRTGHQWEPLSDPRQTGSNTLGRIKFVGVTEIPESLIQDQVVAHESVAFVREQAAAAPDRPWFLTASFSRPHFPYTAPKRWVDYYGAGRTTEPRIPPGGDAWDHPASVALREHFKTGEVSPEETMRARGAYFACVSYLDEVIGDLLARLDRDGLLDNTIIVYATDHGEMAGEHGLWYKQGWFEASARVPLIVSTPEQRRQGAGRRLRAPVALLDLFPTFCAFAGAAPPDGLDGVDLSECVLGDADAPDRFVYTDFLKPRPNDATEFRAVRRGDYKYVRFRNAPPLFFDLKSDPGEQRNLAGRAEGDAARALGDLRDFAEASMDFDEAERERVERDGDLKEAHTLAGGPDWANNMYTMPSGKIVDADTPLYNPRVVSDNPAKFFGDWPE